MFEILRISKKNKEISFKEILRKSFKVIYILRRAISLITWQLLLLTVKFILITFIIYNYKNS